jgi:preprotein translocase subunit SecG
MWINVLIYSILAVHVVCSILLVLIVLMQRPRAEGLGAAFGSGMTESMFGAQTTDILTKATIWLGGVFFVATLSLAVLYSHRGSTVSVSDLMQAPATGLEQTVQPPALEDPASTPTDSSPAEPVPPAAEAPANP